MSNITSDGLMGPTNPFPTRCHAVMQLNKQPVYVVKFNPAGDYCLTGSGDRCAHLWNPYKPEEPYIASFKGGHSYEVLDLDITADSSKIVTAGRDRIAVLWDVLKGTILFKFRGHQEKINSVLFAAQDSLLITGSADMTAKIWDMRQKGRHPVQTLGDCVDSVTSLAATSTDILVGSVDGCVYTYDVRKGTKTVDHLGQSVTSLAITKDTECWLAQCTDSGIRLGDRRTGEVLNTYRGHEASNYPIKCLFTNDDAYVITGCEKGRVVYYSFEEAKLVATLDDDGKVRGEDQDASPVDSDDANNSGSSFWNPNTEGEQDSGSMRMDDMASNSTILQPKSGVPTVGKVHRKCVGSISQHPKQEDLLSASHDGVVALWR